MYAKCSAPSSTRSTCTVRTPNETSTNCSHKTTGCHVPTVTRRLLGMGTIVYTTICSLDGYINDEQGDFNWSAPDAEVHAFVNDLERPMGTYLYGRRIYDVMKVWQTWDQQPDVDPVELDYARVWQS